MGFVETHSLSRETPHFNEVDIISFTQIHRRHLVLAAGLQTLIDLEQALPPPETEQDTVRLGANEKDGATRVIHKMAPFDDLVHLAARKDRSAQLLDGRALPSGQRV